MKEKEKNRLVMSERILKQKNRIATDKLAEERKRNELLEELLARQRAEGSTLL